MVLKPGESHIPRCNFCKGKGHTLRSCPQKERRQRQNECPSKPTYQEAAAAFDQEYPVLPSQDLKPPQQLQTQDVLSNNAKHYMIPSSIPQQSQVQPESEIPEQITLQASKMQEPAQNDGDTLKSAPESNNEFDGRISKDLIMSMDNSSTDESPDIALKRFSATLPLKMTSLTTHPKSILFFKNHHLTPL